MGEKRNKETKGIQGGGALQDAGLRHHGECLQDRKAPSWRSRSFTNLPLGRGTRRQLQQDPRRGGDALRLPGTLTQDLTPPPPGEGATPRRPGSLKGCSGGTARPGSRSEAAPAEAPGGGSVLRELPNREWDSKSAGPGAQGAGDTA